MDALTDTPMRLAALVAVCAALLAAPAQAQPQPEPLTGTLAKIRETGAIRMGVRAASVPFSYTHNGTPIGYAVDICHHVANAIRDRLDMPSLRIEHVPVVPSTRVPLLLDGSVDIECGSTTNNAARLKQVAFSNTYFLTANRLVARAGSGIYNQPGVTAIDALDRQTVASTQGSTNLDQLTRRNDEWSLGMTVLATKDHAEAFGLVESGRAAAFVMDDILLASFVAGSATPADYRISGDAFGMPEPYGIMLRRDDAPFKALVDGATAALYRSPAGRALYNKWFTQPIPPRGLVLNIPMSPGLQRAFANPTDTPDPAAYGF